jgi:putative aminopeptidase
VLWLSAVLDFLPIMKSKGMCAVFALFVFSLLFVPSSTAVVSSEEPAYLANLRNLVDTPAVSSYETNASEEIRKELASFHPTVDNIGDVIVTIGGGSPRRMLVTPIDEPGYVVSAITPDGYLRLRRIPAGMLPPVFNELYSAQPVKVATTDGKWIDGVVAGLSIHLENGRAGAPDPGDVDNMYVDIGATSAAEARKAGVDVLEPVVINRSFAAANDAEGAGASVGDKFGASAAITLLEGMDRSKLSGTLTVAFVTREWSGGIGFHRILANKPCDELIYVGRMLPSAANSANLADHKSPERKPGSGVLLALENASAASSVAADLKGDAEANKITLSADYSAGPIDPGYDPPVKFPANWAHLGIATAWPETPAETVDLSDLRQLIDLLGIHYGVGPQSQQTRSSLYSAVKATEAGQRTTIETLQRLVTTYGVSNHEAPVREAVKKMLPAWAKTETDDAGNLVLHVGTVPDSAKATRILVIAHTDEIGFEVKSIESDGTLEAGTLGGFYMSYFLGHPALIHTATGDVEGIMLPPEGWDQPNFKWPSSTNGTARIDVGAHNAGEVAKLGIKAGDFVTPPKEYRPLLGTRANGRSFDDRVGDAALISAVWALGAPLKDRGVTFVWSTGEELGLVGAGAMARRLAAEGDEPAYVFAVDTFVSADSPLESQRFADAPIGRGFVIRALDNSSAVPRKDVDRLLQLARTNQIPVQYGVTGGGNDGSEFVLFGAIDVAISWPLRYAHSPAEVIDTRDVDSLARIVTVIAKSW